MAEIKNDNDALVLIHLRNDFYRRKYHFLLGIAALGLLVASILAGILIYLIEHPTRPVYFPADKVGRLIYDIPVSQPNMSIDQVTAWTIQAIEATYTYNYINFRSQLQDSEKYFTPYGWQEYMKGLKASNNLLALEQRRMIFLAKVVGSPKLIAEGMLGGAYSYKFQMPVLVQYLTPPYNNVLGKTRFDNALIVDVIVQRQKILSSDKGLAILQLLARSAPPQPLKLTPMMTGGNG